MIPTQFDYLVLSLLFLTVCLVILYLRKDLLTSVLVLSITTAWWGVILEYLFWTRDWWHPQTVTQTRVGFEDFIFSFSMVGIGITIYKFVFNKKYSHAISVNKVFMINYMKRFFLYSAISVIPMFASYYILHLNSFWSTNIGFCLGGIFLMLMRKDLIKPILITPILIIFVSILIYLILNFLSPGWVQSIWDLGKLSGVLILGIPIEDICWYASFGFFYGGVSEWLFDQKITDV